jgi:hypothetical protein
MRMAGTRGWGDGTGGIFTTRLCGFMAPLWAAHILLTVALGLADLIGHSMDVE